MRILASVAAAVALLAAAPAALAHQGSPNFLSQINQVDPRRRRRHGQRAQPRRPAAAAEHQRRDVVIEGYSGEPYARIDADGTVVGQHRLRGLLHQRGARRAGRGAARRGLQGRAALEGDLADRPLRVARPPHALDGARATPSRSRTRTCARRCSTGRCRSQVDGRPGAITGTLFWTPLPSAGLPLGAIFAFAALVIVLCDRGDRRAAPRGRAAPGDGTGGLVIRALAAALAAARAAARGRERARHAARRRRPERGARAEAPRRRRSTLRFNEPVEAQFGAVRVFDSRGPRGPGRPRVPPGRPRRARSRCGCATGSATTATRSPTASSRPTRTRSRAASCSSSATRRRPPRPSADLLDDDGRAGHRHRVRRRPRGAVRGIALGARRADLPARLLAARPAASPRAQAPRGGRLGAFAAPAARAARWPPPRPARCRPRAALVLQGAVARRHVVLGRAERRAWWATCSAPASASGSLCWAAGRRARLAPGSVPVAPASWRDRAALPGDRLAALALPLAALALLPALGGHASVQSPVALLLPANVLHVIAMSAWLGGIAVLVLALRAATARLRGRGPHAAAGRRRRPLLGARRRRDRRAARLGHRPGRRRGPHASPTCSTPRSAAPCSLKIVLFAGDRRPRLDQPLPAAPRARPRRPRRARPRARRRPAAPHAARRARARRRRARRHRRARRLRAVDRREHRPVLDRPPTIGPARLEMTVDPARVGPNEMHLYLFDRAAGRQYRRPPRSSRSRAELPEKRIAPIELDADQGRPGPLRGLRRDVRRGRRLDARGRRACRDFDEFRRSSRCRSADYGL